MSYRLVWVWVAYDLGMRWDETPRYVGRHRLDFESIAHLLLGWRTRGDWSPNGCRTFSGSLRSMTCTPATTAMPGAREREAGRRERAEAEANRALLLKGAVFGRGAVPTVPPPPKPPIRAVPLGGSGTSRRP